jgi:hypothetical protein
MKRVALLVFSMACTSRPSDRVVVEPPPDRAPPLVEGDVGAPSPPTVGSTGVVTVPHTIYDSSGAISGWRDSRGYFFDGNGLYVGRRDNTDAFYDSSGSRLGRVDSAHNYYNVSGAVVGRRNDDGSFFDRSGAYSGRIDVSGNVYDNTGRNVGHVDGVCDESCRSDVIAGRLLY